jgi:hypothetical protein
VPGIACQVPFWLELTVRVPSTHHSATKGGGISMQVCKYCMQATNNCSLVKRLDSCSWLCLLFPTKTACPPPKSTQIRPAEGSGSGSGSGYPGKTRAAH